VPTVTAQKTWQCATLVSALLGNDALNQKDLQIQIKNKRKQFGHVIAGSGNITTGGMDGVDRWSTTTDLGGSGFVFANDPWMVITQPGSGAQDRISFHDGGERDWTFAHSPGGLFTGGSASTLPTAADQIVLYSNSFHGRDDGGHATPLICHLLISADVTCCRQIFFFNNHNYGNIFYDAVDDPSMGWASPNYAVVDKNGHDKSANQNCGMMRQFVYSPTSGSGYFKGIGPHGALNMYGTAESCFDGVTAFHTAPWQFVKNKITGTYRNPSRSGLYEPRSNADGGWHGQLVDWWWVGDSSTEGAFTFGVCSTTPLDASRQFIIVGDMMFPWNGTVPQTA